MSNVESDIAVLERAGRFESREAFLEEAVRALLKKRPELRVELAIEKYKSGEITLNRAAEFTSSSPEEFKETLAERGVSREVGFLSDDEREQRLNNL